MNLSQYRRKQRSITQRIVALVLGVFDTVAFGEVSEPQWRLLMDLIYPEVEKARKESAELAREFYDSEREAHGLDPHPVYLAGTNRDVFHSEMEPYRKDLSRKGADGKDVSRATLGVARSVENAGRKTIIEAVESDDVSFEQDEGDEVTFEGGGPSSKAKTDQKVRGWARVPTGDETCAWCLMLCSRGPVYRDAQKAGAATGHYASLDAYESGVGVEMNEWHPGCDCKVVPVFDDKNWEGRDAYTSMYAEWLYFTQDYDGKDKLRAFRRALERGEVDLSKLPK